MKYPGPEGKVSLIPLLVSQYHVIILATIGLSINILREKLSIEERKVLLCALPVDGPTPQGVMTYRCSDANIRTYTRQAFCEHSMTQYRAYSPVYASNVKGLYMLAFLTDSHKQYQTPFKTLLRADTSDRKSWVMLSGSFLPSFIWN